MIQSNVFDQFKKQIISSIMIDPSILIVKRFWFRDIQRIQFYDVFYPAHFEDISETDYSSIYGKYRRKGDLLSKEETVDLCKRYLKPFSFSEEFEMVRQQDRGKIQLFSSTLLTARHPARGILLDEAEFLLTQSSLLSRLKSILKLFEDFNMFPIINLEKIAPEELHATIRGLKNAIEIARWIATPVLWTILPYHNWTREILENILIRGVRLLIIDP